MKELDFIKARTIYDVPEDERTPFMRQWLALRQQLPEGTILFYRLGDFYEMFGDDARRAAPILNVALSRRAGVMMCGVPYQAVEIYLVRLVSAGLKVAIAEQVEDPAAARRGVIRREIVRIISEVQHGAA